MAQIEQSDKGKKKKGAQKKMSIHVDFTPMVDMNMLLITFFMLCTTMIKSQTLQIALPSNEKLEEAQQNKTKQSEAITLILDSERDAQGHVKTETDEATGQTYPMHVIYYYEGKPYDVPADQIDKNGDGFIDNDSTLTRPVVIIKAGPDASYESVISALDEMQINQISRYQIDNINSVDSMLILSYKHAHGKL